MKIPESEWRWYGDVGHFICGQWCRFHLCTQVGDYLVSTVGRYVHPRHGGGTEAGEYRWLKDNPNGEEVGYGRFYETMVFRAGEPCAAKGCSCGLPRIDGQELKTAGYQTAGEAADGHARLCRDVATWEGDPE